MKTAFGKTQIKVETNDGFCMKISPAPLLRQQSVGAQDGRGGGNEGARGVARSAAESLRFVFRYGGATFVFVQVSHTSHVLLPTGEAGENREKPSESEMSSTIWHLKIDFSKVVIYFSHREAMLSLNRERWWRINESSKHRMGGLVL